MLDPKNLGPGEEQFETFTDCRNRIRCQYDFRSEDGELFSCVRQTYEECVKFRNEWQERRNGK